MLSLSILILNIILIFKMFSLYKKRNYKKLNIVSGVCCRECNKYILNDPTEEIQRLSDYILHKKDNFILCKECERDFKLMKLNSNRIKLFFRKSNYQTEFYNKIVNYGTISAVILLLIFIILEIYGNGFIISNDILIGRISLITIANIVLLTFNTMSYLRSWSFTTEKNQVN